MAMRKTDDVLAELKSLGAVGGPPETPAISEAVVTEVEIEQGPPSVALRDLRGGRTLAAVDEAIAGLDQIVRGAEATREALVHLRRVWEPVEGAEESPGEPLETPETALGGSEPAEGPSMPSEPGKPAEGVQEPQEASPEALARAREMARRKILGEDIPQGQRGEDGEEDNVPFVGQTRAVPMGEEPEEITIGTVDTIKPSFPAEDSDGT